MTSCQIQTKDYLVSKTREVAQAKATRFNAKVSVQQYADRMEATFSGPQAFSAAMGFHTSFNKAFPNIISRPRTVQNNTVVTVPIDINSVNKVINISDRAKRVKSEIGNNTTLQTFKDNLINIIGVNKIKELYAGTDVKFDSFIIDEVELGGDKDLIVTIKTDKGQRTAFNLRLDGDYQYLKISEGGKTIRGIYAPLSEKMTAIDFLIKEFKKVNIDKLTGNIKSPSYNNQKEYYLAKDVNSLLQDIIKFTEDADTKLLAQTLLKIPNVDKIKLNVTKYNKETKDKGTITISPDALGTYSSNNNLLTIVGTLDKRSFETVFLHELIHGITVNEYYSNKEFSNKINTLYNYALKFKDYRTSKGVTLGQMYGMTNAKEFMSEAMSNPDFIYELSKYYSPTQEKLKLKNIFQEFIDLVVGLIKTKIENKGKKYIENNLGTVVLNTITNYVNVRTGNFKSISRLENNKIASQQKQESELEEYIKLNSEEVYADLLNDNMEEVSHEEFLDDLVKNGETEGIKLLAKHLQNLIKASEATVGLSDLQVLFADKESLAQLSTLDPIYGKSLGIYDPMLNRIYLARGLSKAETQRIYLHELAHAITERKIQNDPELKKEFTKLYDKAKQLIGSDPRFAYRFSDVSEFIAGAFNDKFFMSELAKIESVNGKAPNLLMEFVNFVKKILGIKDLSLLDDIYFLVEKTAFSNQKVDTFGNYEYRAEISQEDILNDPNLKKLWNKQVDSINNRIKELTPLTGGADREEAKRRLNILKNSLKDLEGRVTYNALYTVATKDLQTLNYLLNKKEMTAFDLQESLRILQDLESFDAELEGSPITPEFRAQKAEIRQKVINLGVKFRERFQNEILKVARGQGFDVTYEQLTKAVEDMGGVSKLFYSPEYSHIPIMRVAASVLNQYQNNVRDDMAKFEAKERQIKEAFKNFNLNSIFENGHLIGEYTDDYYEQEKDVKDAVKAAWAPIDALKKEGREVPSSLWSTYYRAMNQRFQWYKDNNSYVLTEEGLKRYEKDFEVQKQLLTENGVVDYESLGHWENTHSPLKNQAGYTDSNGKFVFTTDVSPNANHRWYAYFQITPNENFNNPRYQTVKDNPVYNYFREGFLEAFSKIPYDSFLDLGTYHKLLRAVEVDMTENSFRFRGLWPGLKDTIKDWYSIEVKLNDVLGVDNSVTDAFGNPKTVVKVPNFNDLKGTARDPFDLLKKFYSMAVSYEHKVHAAPIADLLHYQLTNIPALRTTVTGAMIRKILKGDPRVVEQGLVNAAKNLRYKIDSVLIERTRLDEEKVMSLTPEEEAELERRTLEWVNNGAKGPAPTVRKVSYVAIFDAIGDYTRLNLIGLKPFSAASNVIMGIASNYLYAARNTEFSDEHLTKAFNLMFQSMFKFWTGSGKITERTITSDAKKITLLAQKFGIVTNLYEGQNEIGKTDIAKGFVELMYKFQESGEYLIHTQIMMAMMFKQQVQDTNGKSQQLWKAYKLSKDSAGNDILVWDEANFGKAPEWNSRELNDASGLNVSKLNDFERRFRQVRIDTQGDYQNALLIKSNVWGRLAMIFRTWIPSAVRQRFGSEIEGEFKGRYRSFVSYYRGNRQSAGALMSVGKVAGKTFLTAAAKMFNFGPFSYIGFNALSKEASRMYEEDLAKMGLSELDIQNMRVNVRELQFIMFCLILAGALKGLSDDDDDPTLTFLTNLAQRTYQDLSFFVLPASTMSVVKDPIPIWKTVGDAIELKDAMINYIVDPQSDIYKRGKRKGQSKVLKELGDITAIYSAYNNTLNVMSQVMDPNSYKYTQKK